MELSNVLKLFILFFTFNNKIVNSYSIRLFEDSLEYEYDCSIKFDPPKIFECACISGLWNLYAKGSECTELLTMGGDTQYCFTLPGFEITRAELLLSDKSHISIKEADGLIRSYSEKNVHEHKIEVSSKDSLIAGMEWTLEDENGNKICLATEENSYCFFSGIESNIIQMTQGCEDGLPSVLPSSCKIINSESKDICSPNHRIEKRSIKGTKGRVFYGAPGQHLGLGNITDIFDEDYLQDNETIVTDDSIASEIWNYFDSKLDLILELREPNEDELDDHKTEDEGHEKPLGRSVIKGKHATKPATKSKSLSKSKSNHQAGRNSKRGKRATTHKKSGGRVIKKGQKPGATGTSNKTMNAKNFRTPVYQYLEMARDIMLKTCPAAYVNPDFLNLAVTTFIKIQKKHFKFPETSKNYYGYLRIRDSLTNCLANVTTFNFTVDSCRSKEKPVTGNYCAFGNCDNELNIPSGFDMFEPMIETVWNIFKNVHAICFGFFNKNFNDHHRFTSWMLPLFQNQINDVWKKSKNAKGIVYGGMLGNQEIVQTAIAYCTASSRMISTYPWDLPRPNVIPDLKVGRRRKRDISMEAECLTHENIPQCSKR